MFGDSNILEFFLTLAIGLICGWALGTVRTHWPMVSYFRTYYYERAEECIRAHANSTLVGNQQYGAAAHLTRAVNGSRTSGGLVDGSRTPLSNKVAPRGAQH